MSAGGGGHGKDREQTRRGVLKAAAVGGAVVGLMTHALAWARSLVPNVLYEPPTRRRIGDPARFPEGHTYLADEKVFVIRAGNTIRALSAICTHLGCTVGTKDKGYHCPCHGSTFSENGAATGGPAPRALPWHPVEIGGGGALVVDLGREVGADQALEIAAAPDESADKKKGERQVKWRPSVPEPLRSWVPRTPRESSEAIVRNFILHAFPARITKRSLSWLASGWLGTITLHIFIILCVTGGVLLFLYVPSVERAYQSVKDIEFVVSFGAWLRGTHRISAHLMVIAVVLHLVRVFLTGAYKKEGAPGAFRPLNWWVGLALLLCTFGLSFTGYLLPWDQLAYWAVTVGTQIAASAPLVGDLTRDMLLGGTVVGQPTLLRFYVLHCFVLPVVTTLLIAYHMWRIRKDGGLAVADRVADDAKAQATIAPPSAKKTHTLMGVTKGGTVHVSSPAGLMQAESVPGVPSIPRRTAATFLIVLAVCSILGLLLHAPLEEPANPAVTPNPAKAPWYFLWLQELVSILTFRIGDTIIDGAFLGGILVPGLLIGALAAWPFLDKSPPEAAGVWFHPSRKRQIRVFLALLFVCVLLTIIGTFFRGPYWSWVWPWESGHGHTSLF